MRKVALCLAIALVLIVSSACNLVPITPGTGPTATVPAPTRGASPSVPSTVPPTAVAATITPTVQASATITPAVQASATVTPTTAAPSATPSVTAAAATLPPATATTQGAPAPRRIVFQPGATSVQIEGVLPAEGLQRYVLRAQAGQTMSVSVTSAQARMRLQINGADGSVLKSFGAGSASWSGMLATTQDYNLAIATENGAAASFLLLVTIPPLASPTPRTPTATAPTRIQFPTGSTSVRLQGTLAALGLNVYVLRAAARQTMTVRATSPQGVLLLGIAGADGQVLKSSGAGTAQWSGVLPTTQDYYLSLSTSNGAAASYTLDVTIPPLPAPTAAQPTRIQFASGSTSATLTGAVAPEAVTRYVLRVLAGQTLNVRVESGQGAVRLQISGADGSVLKSAGAGTAAWSGVVPKTQDYTLGVSTSEPVEIHYTLAVNVPAAH